MSNRTPLFFSKSCLAVAIVALSACSSNPVQDDSAIGAVSDTLNRAGTKTRDLSINAWDKTIYLLGFSDVNPDASQGDEKNNDQLLDEVDLALLEKDAVLPPDFFMPAREIVVVSSPDGLQTPTAFPAPFQTPTVISSRSDIDATGLQRPTTTAAEFETLIEPGQEKTESLDDITSASIADATSVIPEGNSSVMADAEESGSQYFHEVTSSQTLWDIAKSTTGDANNWHTIADVNDLIQSTSVYPGQRLLIPSDLVKPELLAEKPDSDFKTPINSSDSSMAVTNADRTTSSVTGDAGGADDIMDVSDSLTATQSGTERLLTPSSDSAMAEPVVSALDTDAAQDIVQFALGEGESLWDFARRTTGDATNWENIATHNGMDDAAARLVFPGQMIAVPSTMLRTDGPTSEAPKAASKAKVDTVASADNDVTLPDTLSGQIAEGSALRIVEATYQAEPIAPPATVSEDSTVTANTATRREVIVSGTYYPKAVYHDKHFSAPLLMRVSPGTRLQVSQAEGPWLKVETERGTGYLHQRDIR